MKRISAIIIDDEAPARLILKQYIDDFFELLIIAECKNGLEAVEMINKLEPDLIFLDIQISLLNGFQVLQKITHIPKIIFTTAYDQFALKAFDINAVDYLLKPYTQERFNHAFKKCLTNEPKKNIFDLAEEPHTQGEDLERILVEYNGKHIGLEINTIAQIEASGDYSKIITTNQKQYLSSYGISKLEKNYPEKDL
jgi:two-component system, LytTR family, response regulator